MQVAALLFTLRVEQYKGCSDLFVLLGTEAVYSVAWHPHHGIIASGGGDDMAYIWQVVFPSYGLLALRAQEEFLGSSGLSWLCLSEH